MATGELKVSPEKLQAAAQNFSGSAQKIQSYTTQMTQTVNSLSALWAGEAASAYSNRFKGLQDDMQRMFRMIQEHSKDLIAMAKQYREAEKQAANLANSLSSDVIH